MAAAIITDELFGRTTQNVAIKRYTLKNAGGTTVGILNLGGAVCSLCVPDRNGTFSDVVTGYDSVPGYEDNSCYFGVVVGRFANRIAKGKFTLDGKDYQLDVNNGPNHLHGGADGGFSKKVWESHVEGDKLCLKYVSEDGDAKYPGQLTCHVTYQLTSDDELIIMFSATCNKPTPINLTNHSYFNLAGHESPTVYDHRVFIYADKYTPMDETNIPTGTDITWGAISDVAGTAFDLRGGLVLGDAIPVVPLSDPKGGKPGYDHNFCSGAEGQRKLIARVEHDASGRVMECYSDQPGLQFYTANWVDNERGKGGAVYNQHCALCLETQNYPDAPNKPNFPTSILRPGETFSSTTVYKFSTK